jgi:hypothetical protein
MTSLKAQLSETLLQNRPALKESSLSTYSSILSSFYTKMKGEDGLQFFRNNAKEILSSLKDVPSNKRKTLLSGLYILTGIKEYQNLMIEDCKVVNSQNKLQEKTVTQEENWLSFQDIQLKYQQYLAIASKMLNNKQILNEKVMMQFWLLALCSGAVIPPRRTQDYSLMKIRNFDRKTDNFYEKDQLVFQTYKTAKIYGKVVFNLKELAPELNTLMKKWVKVNETDYLLYSSAKKPMLPPQITHLNNDIWGKQVSTNMYRHIYLTNFYENKQIPSLADMEELSKMMGHSILQALQYVKKDLAS